MELAFESKELRSICEREPEAQRKLGQSVAGTLKSRLADLRAAESIRDLPAGSPRTTEVESMPRLVIDLTNGYQVHLIPNHPNSSPELSGACDWTTVRRLKIISISKE